MKPEQFEAKMHQAADAVHDAHTLLQRIALKVEGTAKSNAPVKTGNLRRTVTSQATAHQAIIGASANYAVFVHEGTRFMAARPFIKNAIEQERNWIEDEAARFGAKVFAKVSGG
jgi:phage protein, HK97 gp10 family